MDTIHVVTVFLRHRGDVLLLRRSDDVGSYAGKWGAVAGHVEDDDPDASAREEIEEEAGLTKARVSLVRRGDSFEVTDADRGTTWVVHPYLFDATTRSVSLNWEADEAEWTSPTEILRRDTVPDLWGSYRRVAPTPLKVGRDTSHGSATLSIWALEALRDRAGYVSTSNTIDADMARERVQSTAHQLVDARPSMTALRTRIDRVMHRAGTDPAPREVETLAHEAIAKAYASDEDAAQCAAEAVAGKRVLTLSRSGTVLAALQQADPAPSVVVAESRPLREGVGVAETLAGSGLDTTLITDAATGLVLAESEVDAVLVGADTILPSGAVVNKTGTYPIALAARDADVPVYAAAACDKVQSGDAPHLEHGAPSDVYDGPIALAVRNPTFDVTPAALVDTLLTDRGPLSPNDVNAVAEEWGQYAAWREPGKT